MIVTDLGDDATKSRSAWVGSDAQFDVATRAMRAERDTRRPSTDALADAWRSATRTAPQTVDPRP